MSDRTSSKTELGRGIYQRSVNISPCSFFEVMDSRHVVTPIAELHHTPTLGAIHKPIPIHRLPHILHDLPALAPEPPRMLRPPTPRARLLLANRTHPRAVRRDERAAPAVVAVEPLRRGDVGLGPALAVEVHQARPAHAADGPLAEALVAAARGEDARLGEFQAEKLPEAGEAVCAVAAQSDGCVAVAGNAVSVISAAGAELVQSRARRVSQKQTNLPRREDSVLFNVQNLWPLQPLLRKFLRRHDSRHDTDLLLRLCQLNSKVYTIHERILRNIIRLSWRNRI